MHSSKKTLRTVGVFLLILAVFSAPLLGVFFYSENFLYQDFRERDEFAGTIDYVEIGASRCERGFLPTVIDEAFGVNSYNLGYGSMTAKGRYELLKLEMERNPIRTVVLEVSVNTMVTNPNKAPSEGDFYMVARLGTPARSIPYLLETIRPWDLPWFYCHSLVNGFDSVKFFATGEFRMRNKNQKKGYVPHQDTTVVFKKRSLKTLKRIYHSIQLPTNIEAENDRYLRKTIELCRDNDVEVILVTMPLTQWFVCKNDNINVFYAYYKELAEEYGIPFYDYNLLKRGAELFEDDVHFTDSHHLSNIGAEVFTELFIDMVKRAESGEDVRADFYRDYNELYEHMPYAAEYVAPIESETKHSTSEETATQPAADFEEGALSEDEDN